MHRIGKYYLGKSIHFCKHGRGHRCVVGIQYINITPYVFAFWNCIGTINELRTTVRDTITEQYEINN